MIRHYTGLYDDPRWMLEERHISIDFTPRTPGTWEQFIITYPEGTRWFPFSDQYTGGYIVQLPDGVFLKEELYTGGARLRYISQERAAEMTAGRMPVQPEESEAKR